MNVRNVAKFCGKIEEINANIYTVAYNSHWLEVVWLYFMDLSSSLNCPRCKIPLKILTLSFNNYSFINTFFVIYELFVVCCAPILRTRLFISLPPLTHYLYSNKFIANRFISIEIICWHFNLWYNNDVRLFFVFFISAQYTATKMS